MQTDTPPHATSSRAVIGQYRRHVSLGSWGPRAQDELCAKIGHSSTRHVSSCASRYTEHQHKFSLTYFSCVTVVLFSEPKPVVHVPTYPLRRSTAGWHFYGIPLFHRCSTEVVRRGWSRRILIVKLVLSSACFRYVLESVACAQGRRIRRS